MFFSRSIIFVVFSAVLLTSGAYGQDDDCDDPAVHMQNMQTAFQNILDMGTTLMGQMPLIAQSVQDQVVGIMTSDDMQNNLSDMANSLQGIMGNADDVNTLASQIMGQVQDTLQGAITNPLVSNVMDDFMGNMNDLATSGMNTLGTMQDKMGDLMGPLMDTGTGLMTYLTGPDMTDNLKTMMDSGISFTDATINQAVSGGMSNILGMLNDGLSSMPGLDGLSNLMGSMPGLADMGSLLGSMPGLDMDSLLGSMPGLDMGSLLGSMPGVDLGPINGLANSDPGAGSMPGVDGGPINGLANLDPGAGGAPTNGLANLDPGAGGAPINGLANLNPGAGNSGPVAGNLNFGGGL